MKTLVSILACLLSTVALAAPPAAPVITVAATDIRQLEFNWEPVTAVARYELWFKANDASPWVKYAERSARRAPRFRIGVAVHLLHWRDARYHVRACNRSGCSASNEVGVDGQQLAAMGYFKPPTRGDRQHFGASVALSADGKTLAVLAGETIDAVDQIATVYVYRKTTSTSGWRLEATLIPSTRQSGSAGNIYGDQLAISGNGDLLALGAWRENAGGIELSGAVYLFRRSGVTWHEAQKLTGPGVFDDAFGFLVKLDDAGRTLVISHQMPSGVYEPGTLEVYGDPDDASDQFVHQTTLRDDVSSGSQGWCEGIALSGDGQTLLRNCFIAAGTFVQVLNAPGWTESARLPGGSGDGVEVSHDGRQILVQHGVDAHAWRLGAAGWMDDGALPNTYAVPYFSRRHIALSRDGRIAALGNFMDSTLGRGPIYPPYVADPDPNHITGAVMVYERKRTGWVLRRLVKPDSANESWAGFVVALGDNGRILAVGAPMDPSAARGIDGDRDDASAVFRGAVWLY
jgi:trimeric autotransporter adhesin